MESHPLQSPARDNIILIWIYMFPRQCLCNVSSHTSIPTHLHIKISEYAVARVALT
ncbi:hypothetical protein ACE6H2_027840 [Prunus campanulata]